MNQVAARVAAFIPLALLLVLGLAAPGYFDPLSTQPPSIVGIPLGQVLLAAAVVWMVIGAIAIWFTRSQAAQLAILFFFTFPSLFVVIMAPALILIMQNLG